MQKINEKKNISKVTVLFPVYNEKIEFLKDSILSLINQSYINWQCLIINEGKNKENSIFLNEIVSNDKRFKLIIPNQKIGLAGSLNLGLSIANTEFIARFDSDDIMQKDRLEIQLKFLEKNKLISVVGSNLSIIDKKNKIIKTRKYPEYGRMLYFYFSCRCGLAHPATMFRTKDVKKVGMYNSKLTGAEDLDLWLKMLKNGYKFYNIQKPLLLYRKSSTRPAKHWTNVYKVRKDNFGLFNKYYEKFILFCIKLIKKSKELKI